MVICANSNSNKPINFVNMPKNCNKINISIVKCFKIFNNINSYAMDIISEFQYKIFIKWAEYCKFLSLFVTILWKI